MIELIQISDIYEGGRLLAEHCCSARDFLYPYPSYSTTYGTQDREILLDASIDFPVSDGGCVLFCNIILYYSLLLVLF